MVVRGAHEHPGAVAVEDELGRVINLSRIPLHVRSLPPYGILQHQNHTADPARAGTHKGALTTVHSMSLRQKRHNKIPSQAGQLPATVPAIGTLAAKGTAPHYCSTK